VETSSLSSVWNVFIRVVSSWVRAVISIPVLLIFVLVVVVRLVAI